MNLTTTCPTCGHVEDASSRVCSFCGVELSRAADPSLADAADPPGSGGGPGLEGPEGKAEGEQKIGARSTGRPDSPGDAVAQTFSAGAEEAPLELSEPAGDSTESLEQPLLGEDTAGGRKDRPPADPDASVSGTQAAATIVPPESRQPQAGRKAAAQGTGTAAAAATPAQAAVPDAGAEAKKKQHAVALAKAEAVKKRKLALAKAAALKKKKAALRQHPAAIANIRTQKILRQYLGKRIGINYDHSAVISPAELAAVNGEFLTVQVNDKNLHYHFPLSTILSIIEGTEGKGVPTGAQEEVFDLVVKIFPLVLF